MADCFFIRAEDSHGYCWETKQGIDSAPPDKTGCLHAVQRVMVVAHYVDLQGYAGEVIFKGVRCTNSGEFIDLIVLANRLRPMPHSLEGQKQRKFARQGESQETCYR